MLPGDDVRVNLLAWCEQNGIEAAAIVSAVGSLSHAEVRFGGKSNGVRVEGDLEACSLSGLLSKHGMHVHLAVADGDGRMTGGHLLQGSSVRTTLELVIQEIGGLRFVRRHDERTGYDELFPEEIRP
jgi:hypothetical protein